MYDDCRDITMYPLQMVLPLISQHVGATQSSTIGNNGSSRTHPPPYHLSQGHHHSHQHGSHSSRLTTLSQHLPVELLNCIQPTLNHLANSLANASKESTSSCGGGDGKPPGGPPSSGGSAVSMPLSAFPPLIKTQRPKPAATSGTPRKTWQSCTASDACRSMVNSAEYPHLSEALQPKCKASQQSAGTQHSVSQTESSQSVGTLQHASQHASAGPSTPSNGPQQSIGTPNNFQHGSNIPGPQNGPTQASANESNAHRSASPQYRTNSAGATGKCQGQQSSLANSKLSRHETGLETLLSGVSMRENSGERCSSGGHSNEPSGKEVSLQGSIGTKCSGESSKPCTPRRESRTEAPSGGKCTYGITPGGCDSSSSTIPGNGLTNGSSCPRFVPTSVPQSNGRSDRNPTGLTFVRDFQDVGIHRNGIGSATNEPVRGEMADGRATPYNGASCNDLRNGGKSQTSKSDSVNCAKCSSENSCNSKLSSENGSACAKVKIGNGDQSSQTRKPGTDWEKPVPPLVSLANSDLKPPKLSEVKRDFSGLIGGKIVRKKTATPSSVPPGDSTNQNTSFPPRANSTYENAPSNASLATKMDEKRSSTPTGKSTLSNSSALPNSTVIPQDSTPCTNTVQTCSGTGSVRSPSVLETTRANVNIPEARDPMRNSGPKPDCVNKCLYETASRNSGRLGDCTNVNSVQNSLLGPGPNVGQVPGLTNVQTNPSVRSDETCDIKHSQGPRSASQTRRYSKCQSGSNYAQSDTKRQSDCGDTYAQSNTKTRQFDGRESSAQFDCRNGNSHTQRDTKTRQADGENPNSQSNCRNGIPHTQSNATSIESCRKSTQSDCRKNTGALSGSNPNTNGYEGPCQNSNGYANDSNRAMRTSCEQGIVRNKDGIEYANKVTKGANEYHRKAENHGYVQRNDVGNERDTNGTYEYFNGECSNGYNSQCSNDYTNYKSNGEYAQSISQYVLHVESSELSSQAGRNAYGNKCNEYSQNKYSEYADQTSEHIPNKSSNSGFARTNGKDYTKSSYDKDSHGKSSREYDHKSSSIEEDYCNGKASCYEKEYNGKSSNEYTDNKSSGNQFPHRSSNIDEYTQSKSIDEYAQSNGNAHYKENNANTNVREDKSHINSCNNVEKDSSSNVKRGKDYTNGCNNVDKSSTNETSNNNGISNSNGISNNGICNNNGSSNNGTNNSNETSTRNGISNNNGNSHNGINNSNGISNSNRHSHNGISSNGTSNSNGISHNGTTNSNGTSNHRDYLNTNSKDYRSSSSPSNSSGSNSNKENYGSRSSRDYGSHHYYYNGNGYHQYGRGHGSLHSSRTNSYDDLKTNERYYDSRDFRNSNSKLNETSGGWSNQSRGAYSSSNSPVRYNQTSGGYRGGGKGGNQQRRLRFVENKTHYNNHHGNGYNNNNRNWTSNHSRDGQNYTRGFYYNNHHNYNNNRNYNKHPNNNGDPKPSKVEDPPAKPADPKPVDPPPSDTPTPSPPSVGLADHGGSNSSLSTSSNSGSEYKSLKRGHQEPTSPGRSQQTQVRTHRPLSPYESHHLYYIQNKRRNTSNLSTGGHLHHQYSHPHHQHKPNTSSFPWGDSGMGGAQSLLNLSRHLGSQAARRHNGGPDINFYTPALASLAMQRTLAQGGGTGALLHHLVPPPLVNTYVGTMLTELPWHVPDFETWDPLSKAIWTRFLGAQQTQTRLRQKMTLSKAVEEYVRFTLRDPAHVRLFVVGSTMTGFGLDSSDVDMCLGIRPYEFDRGQAIRVLCVLENNMQHYEIFKKADLIHAKVPILKFQDSSFKLEVDLNCNNVVGVRNTHLLYCYAQMDWRIRPLVLLVKLWAQAHNINDAKNMTISSYSFTLMVIHFLQCGTSPPVLPNLVAQYPTKFSPNSNIDNIQVHEKLPPYRSSNEESLGALLTQFFHYYAHFEYFEYAISVRRGAKIPIEECRNHKSQRNKINQWKYLCIEEPFDLTNTARSVYNLEVFEHIRGVIRKCSSLLEDTQDLQSIFEPLS